MELEDVVGVSNTVTCPKIVIRYGVGAPTVDDEFEFVSEFDIYLYKEETCCLRTFGATHFGAPWNLTEFPKDLNWCNFAQVETSSLKIDSCTIDPMKFSLLF